MILVRRTDGQGASIPIGEVCLHGGLCFLATEELDLDAAIEIGTGALTSRRSLQPRLLRHPSLEVNAELSGESHEAMHR